jgi:hypothetical protein
MIKHIVMWRVRGDTERERQDNIARVCSGFNALKGKIPGLLHLEVGVDVSGIDYACDVVLYTEFEQAQDLAAYATHPLHEQLKKELDGVRTARHQVDYVVN